MPDLREHVLGHAYRLFYGDLDLCGCGSPETAYAMIRDLLSLAPLYEEQRWQLAETLIGSSGAFHMVLAMLQHAGLIDHGGSLCGSWLTDKGRWYLAALREITDWGDIDDAGFPDHECTDACWQAPVGTGEGAVP